MLYADIEINSKENQVRKLKVIVSREWEMERRLWWGDMLVFNNKSYRNIKLCTYKSLIKR